jgi:hypothetical protein
MAWVAHAAVIARIPRIPTLRHRGLVVNALRYTSTRRMVDTERVRLPVPSAVLAPCRTIVEGAVVHGAALMWLALRLPGAAGCFT